MQGVKAKIPILWNSHANVQYRIHGIYAVCTSHWLEQGFVVISLFYDSILRKMKKCAILGLRLENYKKIGSGML